MIFAARDERYEKALKGASHHDSLDVVLHVAARLAKKPLYDSLLVDEVQDFPEAKIGLLLRLTSNPSAVLFGGDTAQTIARTRFRFGQLADFLRRRVGVDGQANVHPRRVARVAAARRVAAPQTSTPPVARRRYRPAHCYRHMSISPGLTDAPLRSRHWG